MTATVRRGRVRTAGAAALAAGAVLTAGCADAGDAASPVSPAAATEAAPSGTEASGTEASTDELRDALLPASVFGADATVVGVTLEQLGSGGLPGWPGGGSEGLPDDVTVDPPLCGAALGALEGRAGDGEAGGGTPVLAAQAALGEQVRTVEVLAESSALEGLQLPVDQLLAACSSVTVSGPEGWGATVDLTALEAPELGDRSAALQVTVSRSGEEPTTALVGIVLDGSRGLLLAQTAAPDAPAPDPAAFTALLADAAEAAAG